jgi:nicotinic acid phosphoribosyltransferase
MQFFTNLTQNITKKARKYHTDFYQFLTCKIITKTSQIHQETYMKFFRNFHKVLGITEVPLAKHSVKIAKIQGKTKTASKTRPKPKHMDGSGYPKRLRSVGLIRIP